MGKRLLENQAAEHEANDIAYQFMNSQDVVSDMEAAYGTSFSHINIHSDAAADDKVKAAGRDAIASGNDIFFGKGILESNTPESKGLLAHELAHTMQQGIAGDSMGGVSEHTEAGAEQGGILDWFKGLFGKKKKPMEVLSVQRDESPEALAYMEAMKAVNDKDKLAHISSLQKENEDKNVAESLRNSNKTFSTTTGAIKTSKALTALGYRTGGNAAANERKQRGVVFGSGMNSGIGAFAKEYVQGALGNGLNFEEQVAMLSGQKEGGYRKRVQGKQFNYTDESLDLATNFFDEFSMSLLDEGGVGKQYAQGMFDAVKKADVFGYYDRASSVLRGNDVYHEDKSSSVMNYVLQTALNGESAKLSEVGSALNGAPVDEEHADNGMAFANNAGAVLMKLPILAKNQKAVDEIDDPRISLLVDQYRSLEEELLKVVTGK